MIVSHHVPTLLNYPEKYKGDVLNQAFAVEHYDFIKESNINYWIFGHHHQNISEFKIGNCQMCTNQLGYVKYYEQQGYSAGKIINL